MTIKVVKNKIDIEIQNDKLDFFYLRNIDVTDVFMTPFRIIMLMEQAEFKEPTNIPLPHEWYAHMPWCIGCSIRRDVLGRIFFVIRNKEGFVEFETTTKEIQSFYPTDEFSNEEELVPGIIMGSFQKSINISSMGLVTDQKEFILLANEYGAQSLFLKSDPFTILERASSKKDVWCKAMTSLPLMIRGLYEEEED